MQYSINEVSVEHRLTPRIRINLGDGDNDSCLYFLFLHALYSCFNGYRIARRFPCIKKCKIFGTVCHAKNTFKVFYDRRLMQDFLYVLHTGSLENK